MDKYSQLETVPGGEDEDTFEMTAAAMRQEGVSLRTLDEIKQVGEKLNMYRSLSLQTV